MSTDSLKKKKQESNKIISNIDGVSIQLNKDTAKFKKEIIKETLKINETKKPYTTTSLVAKAVDLKMKGIIASTKTDFRDFLNNTQRYLAKNYSINLTKRDLEAIASKKDLILDDLAANTDVLSRDLKKAILGNLAKGIPTRDLALELAEIYPAFERNAETILRTGLGRTFSDINVSKFQEQDYNWYTWAGPNDSLTREIPCKHFVNKKFPASQLVELNSIRQTLYNCRHSIIPLTDQEAKNMSEGNIKDY